jgi:DNA-binding beta-propeller fold protein YncE
MTGHGFSAGRYAMTAAIATLLVAACGDGDGMNQAAGGGAGAPTSGSGATSSAAQGGSGAAAPDHDPPAVTIAFPPAGAIVAAEVTVRGTASDASTIASVTVNGVAAESGDGHATWQALVPLMPGDNVIVVASSDALGNHREEESIGVRRIAAPEAVGTGPALLAAYGAALRPDGKIAYFVDDVPDGLIEVDLRTGLRREIVSDDPADAETERDIVRPLAVAVLDDVMQFLLIDSGAEALLGADAGDGSHWIISSATVGSGPLGYPAKVHLGPAEDFAYILDFGLATVLQIDLRSGERIPITDASLEEPNGLGVSPDGTRVYVAEPYTPALVAIERGTRQAHVVSSDEVGRGPPLGRPTQVAVAGARNEALVWDADGAALVAVDLGSGDRRIAASADVGRGHALETVDDLATSNTWLLVLDAGSHALVALDPASGDRVIVAK